MKNNCSIFKDSPAGKIKRFDFSAANATNPSSNPDKMRERCGTYPLSLRRRTDAFLSLKAKQFRTRIPKSSGKKKECK